jgi:hypothetical protein
MAEMQRGVVKPPNEGEFSSNKANNGFMPLSRDASPCRPPNETIKDGDPGGSFSLAKMASPVNPPNMGLKDGDPGYTPRPGSAVEPGKGAVPVNPFLVSGGIRPAMPVADMAKPR